MKKFALAVILSFSLSACGTVPVCPTWPKCGQKDGIWVDNGALYDTSRQSIG